MTRALLTVLIATMPSLAGCNGNQGPAQTATERPMIEKTSTPEAAHEVPEPGGAIRLRKGTNTRVGAYELGVMWIAEGTGAGATAALEIKLSVFHPESGRDEERILRAGDTLALGDAVYELIRLEPKRGADEAYGVIAPRSP